MAATTLTQATGTRQRASRPAAGGDDQRAPVPAGGKPAGLNNRAAVQKYTDSIEHGTEAHFDETAHTNLDSHFSLMGSSTA